jgi:hypothetical protein
MIPIAEMIERYKNNRRVGGGILRRNLCVLVMSVNVRRVNNVPFKGILRAVRDEFACRRASLFSFTIAISSQDLHR